MCITSCDVTRRKEKTANNTLRADMCEYLIFNNIVRNGSFTECREVWHKNDGRVGRGWHPGISFRSKSSQDKKFRSLSLRHLHYSFVESSAPNIPSDESVVDSSSICRTSLSSRIFRFARTADSDRRSSDQREMPNHLLSSESWFRLRPNNFWKQAEQQMREFLAKTESVSELFQPV